MTSISEIIEEMDILGDQVKGILNWEILPAFDELLKAINDALRCKEISKKDYDHIYFQMPSNDPENAKRLKHIMERLERAKIRHKIEQNPEAAMIRRKIHKGKKDGVISPGEYRNLNHRMYWANSFRDYKNIEEAYERMVKEWEVKLGRVS